MEQLTQNLKDGDMQILEVPFPMLGKGSVLVRNHYSIISAGTEGKTVKDARLGYIGKAMARKDDVKKVINTAKTIGITETYKLLMNKLEAPSALGYSCSGEVIAVADDITEFKIGDHVACGGAGAVHAEVVAVPRNLCVKLPDNVHCSEAAFTTLGAIAMQGIRQADLRLGESCVVIGLGLLGQLTMQMLQASGVKSIGIDIDSKMVDLARELGASLALNRNQEGLEQIIADLTQGYGADAVIITAATSSTDPVDLAGTLCRQKGKVIIVGAVPTGFKRSGYYKKELELKMSCSYGPGRYDRSYEEAGTDYPYGYVRWTENRNMQAFVELLHQGKLQIKPLTSHVFDFKEAKKAYQMIVDKTEPYTGILLKYNLEKTLRARIDIKTAESLSAEPSLGFIGAGSFAGNVLLPALKGQCRFTGIATNRPNNARNMADKYGFSYCTANVSELLNDKNINTIFVATRHDSHAAYVLESIHHGKHVFVEKPLCLHEAELEQIREAYEKGHTQVMVGFNRRFAPQIVKAKKMFAGSDVPLAIHYRINAGTLPADHWIHDLAVGGGRIIGEACHFIDLVAFLAGSAIVSVSAMAMKTPGNLRDTLTINLQFKNGSIANITYFSNGNKNLSKEYIEIFGAGQVTVIDDFKDMTVYGSSAKKESTKQDKGHRQEVTQFLESIRQGKAAPISFGSIYNSMLATFKVEESIALGGAPIPLPH
ncbi:MAG: bi-domain-containing oxidoreductase [Bacteroidetes bacterium]|nr:bi-domain-containing oxidoreductase [Bacteroidota bacterium]